MTTVSLDIRDRVADVRLRKPPVNPLSASVVQELRSAIAECRSRSDVRALVLTGSQSHFAAGGDINEFRSQQLEGHELNLSAIRDCMTVLEHLPIPTIAALEGPAVGGGWELALACDIRIASTDAKIGLPELRLGLLAASGGTQRMLHVLGKGRVLEMLYTGRLLSAEQAHSLGLIERLAPPLEAVSEAMELGRVLSRQSRPALAAAKACVLAGLESGLSAGLQLEFERGIELFGGEDAAEGLQAFVEKREPNFV